MHFSVQADHVHLPVEADGIAALARGVQGLSIRLAKAINRVLGRRGRIWADRFHARALRTPREVRNGLVYVLMNGRKHGVSKYGLDPCSSALWVEAWRQDETTPTPVVRARSWLLSVGWQRGGQIGQDAAPAMGHAARRSATRCLRWRVR